MLSATTFQGYKKCCMLAMDVWCFSKSTIRVDLEKHQTRLHYWGNSLCNFEESPLQLWGILLYNKQRITALLRNCFHGQISCRRSAGVNQKQPICKHGRRKRRSKNEPVLMVYRVLYNKFYLAFYYTISAKSYTI